MQEDTLQDRIKVHPDVLRHSREFTHLCSPKTYHRHVTRARVFRARWARLAPRMIMRPSSNEDLRAVGADDAGTASVRPSVKRKFVVVNSISTEVGNF